MESIASIAACCVGPCDGLHACKHAGSDRLFALIQELGEVSNDFRNASKFHFCIFLLLTLGKLRIRA